MLKRLLPAIAAAAMCSCSHPKAAEAPAEPPMARVGSTILYRSEVAAAVPPGLSEADSVDFVRRYVNRWIDARLIDREASAVLNMDEIDRRVEQYRRDLITAEYRRYRFDSKADTILSDEELQQYYQQHKQQLVAERPLIKGIYMKLPDDTPRLREIKRLLQTASHDDINRLEGMVATSAIHYDYFLDKWIEWRRIEQIVPRQFDHEPADVVSGRNLLDISLGGFTYLLKVKEYLPAGSQLPYDEALPQIKQRMLNQRRMEFDSSFLQQLRSEAEKSGEVEVYL